jgi:hypothetical protein
MEESMGYERSTIPAAIRPAKRVPGKLATAATPVRPVVVRGEENVLRHARQLRDEWRQQRYARLKFN